MYRVTPIIATRGPLNKVLHLLLFKLDAITADNLFDQKNKLTRYYSNLFIHSRKNISYKMIRIVTFIHHSTHIKVQQQNEGC